MWVDKRLSQIGTMAKKKTASECECEHRQIDILALSTYINLNCGCLEMLAGNLRDRLCKRAADQELAAMRLMVYHEILQKC